VDALFLTLDRSPSTSVRGSLRVGHGYASVSHAPPRTFDTIGCKAGSDAVSARVPVILDARSGSRHASQDEIRFISSIENSRQPCDHTKSCRIDPASSNSHYRSTEVDGERSSVKTKHPLFADPAVRQALRLLVDRGSVQAHIYGRTGVATGNFINAPGRFVSQNTSWEFNSGERTRFWNGGWMRGPNGIRAKTASN